VNERPLSGKVQVALNGRMWVILTTTGELSHVAQPPIRNRSDLQQLDMMLQSLSRS
jgi:hypothetical protein